MSAPRTQSADHGRGPRQTLSVADAVGIIVGLIVGAGIFGTPSIVAGALESEGLIISAWIAGGIFSIIGALCYAELATAFLRVANLEAPPTLLLSPANVLRVIRGNFARRVREPDAAVGRISDPSAVAQRAKAEA